MSFLLQNVDRLSKNMRSHANPDFKHKIAWKDHSRLMTHEDRKRFSLPLQTQHSFMFRNRQVMGLDMEFWHNFSALIADDSFKVREGQACVSSLSSR